MSIVRAVPLWISNQVFAMLQRDIQVVAFTDRPNTRIRFVMPKCHCFDLLIIDDQNHTPCNLIKFADYVQRTLQAIKLRKRGVRNYHLRGDKFGIDIEHMLDLTNTQVSELLSTFYLFLESDCVTSSTGT